MAMTKAEKAAFEEVATQAALRWTNPVQPDVLPGDFGTTLPGWDFNDYTFAVFKAWTTSSTHGTGEIPVKNHYTSGSQGSRRLYSTEALALAALRHAVERKAAQTLRSIDRKLAAAAG